MIATAFVLKSTGTDQTVALGLLCPDVRYASVLWSGADRIKRLFCTPDDWSAITRELREGLPPTALPKASTCARVLADGQGVRVQWMWGRPVEVEEPAAAAAALDEMLREATR